mmetsp:Transcript_10879/g.24719  ORF Transcript_10879/g.24719 Transcript_10879/m.24719 type:complete len:363 (+) Transcript_10879:2907-3995(+)
MVVQDVASGLCQHVQDLVLDLLEFLLALCNLDHQLALHLLELWPLEPNHQGQELVLQPLGGHGEVDYSDLDTDLGWVVGIRELCGDVEGKLRRVVDVCVAEPDHKAAGLLERLLLQHRLESWVESFLDILKQHRVANADAVLEGAEVCLLRQFDDSEGVFLLLCSNPAVGLRLRVNQQRPPPAPCHDDAVLHAELVRGEALERPLAHFDRVGHDALQREVRVHGDSERGALGHPGLDEPVTVSSSEGSRVRKHGGGNKTVADEVVPVLVELLKLCLPPNLLASQSRDELLSTLQTGNGFVRLRLQLVALVHGCSELVLQRLHTCLLLSELGLLGAQDASHLRPLLFRRLEALALGLDCLAHA